MHGPLQGVLAVVTGAASGLGAATVNALSAQGALVASVDLLDPDDPRWPDPTSIRFRADVSDERDVELLVSAVARHGSAAILVNCAGIGSTTDTVNTTVETWDRVFAVNARGSFLTCRGFLPGMIESRQGSIVNVASVAGLVGLRDRAAYCASKGAVIALTRAIAVDHVSAGVRAHVVCPGTVDSPWVQRLTAEVGVHRFPCRPDVFVHHRCGCHRGWRTNGAVVAAHARCDDGGAFHRWPLYPWGRRVSR